MRHPRRLLLLLLLLLSPRRAYADGDGVFGSWLYPDAFGGVAYNYSADQTADPRAFSNDTDPFVRIATEHNFVVGNFRLVAHASNYGYLQVRSDESAPLWHAEAAGVHPGSRGTPQFGLGWGYLFDTAANATVLSTFYDGAGAVHERVFGMGYATKAASAGGLHVRQTVVAPFGDDAALVSAVTLTNAGTSARSVAWVENGGGALRLLDRLSATVSGPGDFRDGRAFANAHYTSRFTPTAVGGGGLRQERAWRPLNASEAAAYAAVVAGMRESQFGGPPMPFPPPSSSPWAEVPPAATIIDVSPLAASVGAAAFGSDCGAFYGRGGRAAPDGLRVPLTLPAATAPAANAVGCLLAAKTVELPPGGSATLAFLWAYDSDGGKALPGLAAKYGMQVAADSLVSSTVAAWLDVSVAVNGSTAVWVPRETLWNSYMTLSAATADGGFGERMLDQGTSYRYAAGFQGAPRDPAQHLLPAVAVAPWLARSVLRYLLQMVQKHPSAFNGSSAIGGVPMNLPYGVVNRYMLFNLWLRPSDQELYVLLATAEYLLATRDFAFLDEPLWLYGDRPGGPSVPAVTALQSCLNFSLVNVTVGAHGLMRVLTSDWSDTLCDILLPGCAAGPGTPLWDTFFTRGESVLNAAMATFALARFADALTAADAVRFAGEISRARTFAAGQVAALARGGDAWSTSGPWLRRAYLGSNAAGWAGNDNLFATPHSWALLSGAIAGADAAAVLGALRAGPQAASPIGMPVVHPPLPGGGRLHEGENGGVWPALNHPVAWAMGRFNLSQAWVEWAANSLRASANAYPAYWGSIWSSADSANGVGAASGAGRAGFWTTSWPTQCTHRHAWPLFSLLRLAGVDFDAHGLTLSPGLAPPGGGEPGEWGVRSPLVSVRRTAAGGWAGHWTPAPPAPSGMQILPAVAAAAARLGASGALPVPIAALCEWAAWCGPAHAPRVALGDVTLRAMTQVEAARVGGDVSAFRMADVSVEPVDGCVELHWELACA